MPGDLTQELPIMTAPVAEAAPADITPAATMEDFSQLALAKVDDERTQRSNELAQKTGFGQPDGLPHDQMIKGGPEDIQNAIAFSKLRAAEHSKAGQATATEEIIADKLEHPV